MKSNGGTEWHFIRRAQYLAREPRILGVLKEMAASHRKTASEIGNGPKWPGISRNVHGRHSSSGGIWGDEVVTLRTGGLSPNSEFSSDPKDCGARPIPVSGISIHSPTPDKGDWRFRISHPRSQRRSLMADTNWTSLLVHVGPTSIVSG